LVLGRSVLGRSVAFRCKDCGAAFAFLQRPDIAHQAIDGDGITVFIESLDLDARFLGFHPHTSAVAEKRDHPDAIGETVVPFGDLPKPPRHFCAGHSSAVHRTSLACSIGC
jgi:hypothetical protein